MCVARTLIDLPTFAGSKQPTTQRNDEETITHACSPPWDGLRILGMLEKR